MSENNTNIDDIEEGEVPPLQKTHNATKKKLVKHIF